MQLQMFQYISLIEGLAVGLGKPFVAHLRIIYSRVLILIQKNVIFIYGIKLLYRLFTSQVATAVSVRRGSLSIEIHSHKEGNISRN